MDDDPRVAFDDEESIKREILAGAFDGTVLLRMMALFQEGERLGLDLQDAGNDG